MDKQKEAAIKVLRERGLPAILRIEEASKDFNVGSKDICTANAAIQEAIGILEDTDAEGE